MNNDHQLLKSLTNSLEKALPIINNILQNDKKSFSCNEEHINIVIGLLNEIKEISLNLSDDLCYINKTLYDNLQPIVTYANNLFGLHKLVNSYKLYDALKIDVVNLANYLFKLKE